MVPSEVLSEIFEIMARTAMVVATASRPIASNKWNYACKARHTQQSGIQSKVGWKADGSTFSNAGDIANANHVVEEDQNEDVESK